MKALTAIAVLWLLALTLNYWHERAHHPRGSVGMPGAVRNIEQFLGVWHEH